MKSKFDIYLGRIKQYDSQVIEKTVEVRGGGSTTVVSGGGTASVTVSADEPASGNQGDMWLDTDDNVLYVYVNGVWTPIAGGGSTIDGVFLTEDGDYLVLENDDYLTIET